MNYFKRLFQLINYFKIKFIYKKPNVLSRENTLKQLINSNKSLARYGDGELNMINYYNIGFQNYDQKLSNRLKEIILSINEDCYIAIPESLNSLKAFKLKSKLAWMQLIGGHFKYYNKYLIKDVYLNSQITRPYLDYKTSIDLESFFKDFKKIWSNKRILIVEGEYSRLGLGNDLFDNVHSCNRLITLSKNAFSKYDEIYEYIILNKTNYDLILIALGPTATVLAYDLSKDIRALDLGHFDIEYEWFKNKATKKENVKGRVINEVINSNLEELDYELLKKYQNQIIRRIL
ncbi:GT-D fold domain-containing glycosyltransferase [Empedobacter falsenii]